MTDIVERLRRERETDHLCIEAADEIERLREELADVRADAALLRKHIAKLEADGGQDARL